MLKFCFTQTMRIKWFTIGPRRVMRSLSRPTTTVTRLMVFVSFALILIWGATMLRTSTLCINNEQRITVNNNRLVSARSSLVTKGGFYQISNSDVFIHSAFFDNRYTSKYIRIFGMHNTATPVTVRCRLKFEGGVKVDLPIETNYPVYKKWPSTKLRYHAYYYGCGVPDVFDFSKNFTLSLLVEGSDTETVVPLHMSDVKRQHRTFIDASSDNQSRRVVVCVKAMWGWVNSTRLVEWLEFHSLLGINKIAIYDTTILGQARRVLDYYQQTGLVDVISFDFTLKMATLMQKDPFKVQLADEDLLLEQTYLVSMNDCYYRYKDVSDYILVIDHDEIIVPMKEGLTLGQMMLEAEKEKLNASAFHFQTSWHLDEFGMGNKQAPTYLHMQRYTKRSPVMQSQPKAIISALGAIVINWHGSVTMPSSHGFQGNQYLQWQRFGYVHHFRKKCKYDESKCAVIAQMTELDPIIPRYENIMTARVQSIISQLNISP